MYLSTGPGGKKREERQKPEMGGTTGKCGRRDVLDFWSSGPLASSSSHPAWFVRQWARGSKEITNTRWSQQDSKENKKTTSRCGRGIERQEIGAASAQKQQRESGVGPALKATATKGRWWSSSKPVTSKRLSSQSSPRPSGTCWSNNAPSGGGSGGKKKQTVVVGSKTSTKMQWSRGARPTTNKQP